MIFAATRPERVQSLTVISSASEVGSGARQRGGELAQMQRSPIPRTVYRVSLPFNFSPWFVDANPQVIEQGEERLAACPRSSSAPWLGSSTRSVTSTSPPTSRGSSARPS